MPLHTLPVTISLLCQKTESESINKCLLKIRTTNIWQEVLFLNFSVSQRLYEVQI